MKIIEFSGTYYDLGLHNGRLLVGEKAHGFPPKFSQEKIEKAKDYELVVKDYFPEILDEFRGMAEASGVDYEKLIAFEVSPFRMQPNCLVIAISGKHTIDGKPIFLRNHEWIEEDATSLRVLSVKLKGAQSSVGFTFSWPLASRYGGVNEKGLVISSASASFVNSGPGIILNIATRWILDHCKTLEEAVEFITNMPKVWGESYLIMDKEQRIVRIESHKDKTNVIYSDKGFDFVTLAYISPEMQQFNMDKEDGSYKYFMKRKNFLNSWIEENKGKINYDSLTNILKDCNLPLHYHAKSDWGTEGTCWTWIASPGNKEIAICPGAPCKNDFIAHKFQTI